MYNPLTGKNETYVESWCRLPSQAGTPYCLLQRQGAEGYLGRVGDHTLGIEREAEVFRAYRDELRDGHWTRVFSQHGEKLPRLPVVLPAWTAGEVVELDGQCWVVHTAGRTS